MSIQLKLNRKKKHKISYVHTVCKAISYICCARIICYCVIPKPIQEAKEQPSYLSNILSSKKCIVSASEAPLQSNVGLFDLNLPVDFTLMLNPSSKLRY